MHVYLLTGVVRVWCTFHASCSASHDDYILLAAPPLTTLICSCFSGIIDRRGLHLYILQRGVGVDHLRDHQCCTTAVQTQPDSTIRTYPHRSTGISPKPRRHVRTSTLIRQAIGVTMFYLSYLQSESLVVTATLGPSCMRDMLDFRKGVY